MSDEPATTRAMEPELERGLEDFAACAEALIQELQSRSTLANQDHRPIGEDLVQDAVLAWERIRHIIAIEKCDEEMRICRRLLGAVVATQPLMAGQLRGLPLAGAVRVVPGAAWIRRRVLEHLSERRCQPATATSIWWEGGLRQAGVELHVVAWHLEQMEAAGQLRRDDFTAWELAL